MKFSATLRHSVSVLILALVLAFVFLTSSGLVAEDTGTPGTATVAHVGIWNGSRAELNVVECSNLDRERREYNLVVLNPDGKQLALKQFSIAPLGTTHINLKDVLTKKLAGRYGTYRIESPGGATSGALTCLTSVYRAAEKKAKKALEFGYVIPSPFSVVGVSGGVLESGLSQELLVYNPGEDDFSAKVDVFGKDGEIDEQRSFSVAGLKRGEVRKYKIASSDSSSSSSRIKDGSSSLYRVTPTDSESEYGAVLVSFSRRGTAGYNYALSKLALEGSCDGGPIFVSTRDKAEPIARLANVGESKLAVELEVRDADGKLVHSAAENLSEHSQKALPLSQYLGADSVGSYRAHCSGEGALLSEVTHYGRAKKKQIEWAYATQARGILGSSQIAIASSLKTAAQARSGSETPQPDNRSAIVNAGPNPLAVKVTLFEGEGSEVGGVNTKLASNGSAATSLYQQIGPDFKGLGVSISSDDGAQFSSELLRIFPKRGGGVGYIVSVPSTQKDGREVRALLQNKSAATDTEIAYTPQLAALGAATLQLGKSAAGPFSSPYVTYVYGEKIYLRVTGAPANSDIQFKWTDAAGTVYGPMSLPNPGAPGQNYRTDASGNGTAGPLPSSSGIDSSYHVGDFFRNWVCFSGTCSNEVDYIVATTNPPAPILELAKTATGPWSGTGATFYYGDKIYMRIRGTTANTTVWFQWNTNGSPTLTTAPIVTLGTPAYQTDAYGQVVVGPFPSATGIPTTWPSGSAYQIRTRVSNVWSSTLSYTVTTNNSFIRIQGLVFDGATGKRWGGNSSGTDPNDPFPNTANPAVTLDPQGSGAKCGPNADPYLNTATTCIVPGTSASTNPNPYYVKGYVYSTNYVWMKSTVPTGKTAVASVCYGNGAFNCYDHPFSSWCKPPLASGKASHKVTGVPTPRPQFIDWWWGYVATANAGDWPDCGANGLPVSAPTTFNYTLANTGNVTVTAGGSGTTTINATRTAGTAYPVAFDLSGAPQGVTLEQSKASCNPTCSFTITARTTSNVSPGTFPITVRGNSPLKTTTFNLVVNGISIPQQPSDIEGWAFEENTTNGLATTVSSAGLPNQNAALANGYFYRFSSVSAGARTFSVTLPSGFLSAKSCNGQLLSDGAFSPTCSTGWVNGTSRTITVYPGENMRLRWRFSRTAAVTPPSNTALGNNAACGGIQAPATVVAGQSFRAQITMFNTGTRAWTADATPHRLGSQNPLDNTRWGTHRLNLPTSVNPGSAVTFELNATPPVTSGIYTFDWQMLEESTEWFGEGCSRSITVEPAPVAVFNPALSIYDFQTPLPSPPTLIGAVATSGNLVFQSPSYGRGGSTGLAITGNDLSAAGTAYAYHKVYDLSSSPVPITTNTWLEYWINPLTIPGKWVAVDLILDNGQVLRDQGIYDIEGIKMHPDAQGTRPNFPVGQFKRILGYLGGKLAGRSITAIVVAFDQKAASGNIQGYFNTIIDDIAVFESSRGKISVGDLVTVGTYAPTPVPALDVRSGPSSIAPVVGTQANLTSGTTVLGPLVESGRYWWKVDFSSGPDGWVQAEALAKVTDLTSVVSRQIENFIQGDVDGSGTVSVTDGVKTLRAASGLENFCDPNSPDPDAPRQCYAADCDHVNSVTVTDGVNVLRKAAGLTGACDTVGALEQIPGTDFYTNSAPVSGNPKCRELPASSRPPGRFCADYYGDPTTTNDPVLGNKRTYRFIKSEVLPSTAINIAWNSSQGLPQLGGRTSNVLITWGADIDFPADDRDDLYTFKGSLNGSTRLIVDGIDSVPSDRLFDQNYDRAGDLYNSRLLSGRHNVRLAYWTALNQGQMSLIYSNRPITAPYGAITPVLKAGGCTDPGNLDCVAVWTPREGINGEEYYFKKMGGSRNATVDDGWTSRLDGEILQNGGLASKRPGAGISFRWRGRKLYALMRSGKNKRGHIGVSERGVERREIISKSKHAHFFVLLADMPDGDHEYVIAPTDELRSPDSRGDAIVIEGFSVLGTPSGGGYPPDQPGGNGYPGRVGVGQPLRIHRIQATFSDHSNLFANYRLAGILSNDFGDEITQIVQPSNPILNFDVPAGHYYLEFRLQDPNTGDFDEYISFTGRDILSHGCFNCFEHPDPQRPFERDQDSFGFTISNGDFVDIQALIVPENAEVTTGFSLLLANSPPVEQSRSATSPKYSLAAAQVTSNDLRWTGCLVPSIEMHPSVSQNSTLVGQVQAARNDWNSNSSLSRFRIDDIPLESYDIPAGKMDRYQSITFYEGNKNFYLPLIRRETSFDRIEAGDLAQFGVPAGSIPTGITISWGWTSAELGRGEPVHRDILVNQNRVDTTGGFTQGKSFFQNVIKHEMGHYLGLGHYISGASTSSVMWYDVSGSAIKMVNDDDRFLLIPKYNDCL